MMLRSSVRNFGKLCRYHPSFAALSILSLLITTLSFLVLMEKSYYTYQVSLTQEYLYGEKYGMGIVLAGGNAGIGRYEIA